MHKHCSYFLTQRNKMKSTRTQFTEMIRERQNRKRHKNTISICPHHAIQQQQQPGCFSDSSSHEYDDFFFCNAPMPIPFTAPKQMRSCLVLTHRPRTPYYRILFDISYNFAVAVENGFQRQQQRQWSLLPCCQKDVNTPMS